MAKKAHPGFKAAAREIARKEGVSIQTADKELAARTREAGAAARAHNAHLKRVK